VERVDLAVPAISCGHCVATIQRVLTELPGVASVDANVETKRVDVVFGPPATLEEIVATLREWDFPPQDRPE